MKALRVGATALVVLAAGCGSGEESTSAARAVSTRTSLTPTAHLFAEPVVARLDVVFDPNRFDAGRVRLQTSFKPYEVLRTTRTEESVGGLARLRYEYTLRCLLIECIPKVLPSVTGEDVTGRGERLTFQFKAARVLYEDPKSGERVLRRAPWPSLQSVSRINPSDVPRFGFVFKTSVTPVAAPTYRISPNLLAAGLIAAALALLALPTALVAHLLRRRRPDPVAPEAELPPLERALRLVEWANTRENGTERREALEILAVELAVSGNASLAEGARKLAWSQSSPAAEDAGRFVTSVREADREAA